MISNDCSSLKLHRRGNFNSRIAWSWLKVSLFSYVMKEKTRIWISIFSRSSNPQVEAQVIINAVWEGYISVLSCSISQESPLQSLIYSLQNQATHASLMTAILICLNKNFVMNDREVDWSQKMCQDIELKINSNFTWEIVELGGVTSVLLSD